MAENLIKKYLLEKAFDNGKQDDVMKFGEYGYQQMLYEQLKKGELNFDEKDFDDWLKNYKLKRTLFGLYLLDKQYISDDDKIIEVTEDKNYGSIGEVTVNNEREKIIELSGDSYCTRPSKNNINGHLVINGIYANQMIYLARSCCNGAFTVGYYGDKNSLYTKHIIDYYKRIKRCLQTMTKDSCETVEDHIFSGDKIYLLSSKPRKNK